MRLLIDSLIAMMLIAILAGVIFHHRQQQDLVRQYSIAHREFASLREAIAYHSALDQDSLNEFNHPDYPSPMWFPEGLPSNRLVPGRHPWFDIAPPGDLNDHPPDPVIHSPEQAGYWYNPSLGVVRARVMPLFTEQATLTLYNQINTTMLVSLPRSKDPARRPRPHPLLSSELNADQVLARQTLMNRPQKWTAPNDTEPKQADAAGDVAQDVAQDSTPKAKQDVAQDTTPAASKPARTLTLMSAAKPSTKSSDKPAARERVEPAEKPAQAKASLRTTTLLGDKPASKPVVQPVEKPAEQPVEPPVEQSAEQTDEQAPDQPIEQAVEKAADEPAVDPDAQASDKASTQAAALVP